MTDIDLDKLELAAKAAYENHYTDRDKRPWNLNKPGLIEGAYRAIARTIIEEYIKNESL